MYRLSEISDNAFENFPTDLAAPDYLPLARLTNIHSDLELPASLLRRNFLHIGLIHSVEFDVKSRFWVNKYRHALDSFKVREPVVQIASRQSCCMQLRVYIINDKSH